MEYTSSTISYDYFASQEIYMPENSDDIEILYNPIHPDQSVISTMVTTPTWFFLLESIFFLPFITFARYTIFKDAKLALKK